MIKTSVIIPVYNTGQYLEECIDSVFNQTQKEIEVIAINDGSTDDSGEVLLHLKRKYPNLTIIAQENRGQGYARNVGIERARGEYIYFLDSDDYILKDTLESCYECASKNKLDIVLFDALEFEGLTERKEIEPNNCDRHDIIKERDEVFSGIYFLEKYYRKTYIPVPWSMYCSTVFLKANDIWFLTGVYFEDNEYYCKVMTLADRIMYIPKMFYQYRCREDSTTGSKFDLRKARDHIEVISVMSDLKSLRDGKGWHVIKKISLNLLLYVSDICCNNSLYYKDDVLPEQILNTWMRICGNTIENTNNLEDIDYIYKISGFFPNLGFEEIKKQIEDKRKRLLVQVFRQLPLDQKGSRVAVYGCGKYTDRILDFYEEYVGAAEADILFMISNAADNQIKYRGRSVYSIDKLEGEAVDYILISSPQYEEEMSNMIQQLYGNKFSIILLHGDLHINI